MKYFHKFPTIEYQGYQIYNIFARAVVDVKAKQTDLVYYPYTMKDGERADIVADRYYGSPGYTWLVWMSNDTIDPYYDVSFDEYSFDRLIAKKYGSVEAARRKISHYRNDWEDDITSYTQAQFDALSPELKAYYIGVQDQYGTITSYERKRIDWNMATNKIVSLTVNAVSGTFTKDEEVRVDVTNYAYVVTSNTTNVIIKHVQGTFANSNVITGQSSGATATVVSSNTLHQSISNTVSFMWSPVTYYDVEREKLEQSRYVQLIDARKAGDVNRQLTKLMSRR